MNFKIILSALALTIPLLTATAQEPLGEMIERGLSVSRTQSLTMARSLEKQNDLLPKTYENGQLVTCSYHWWVPGFFPGVLWQLYSDRGDNELRRYAELFTDRVEDYINTGSEYLCCAVFCALGLPADDPFRANPAADWTSRKAWDDVEVPADHAL